MKLNHTKVCIAGLGKSGVAAAEYCARQGAQVTVCDAARADRFAAERERLAPWPIVYRLGEESVDCFAAADLVVASPGVPLTTRGCTAAREAGIPIVSEMELALHACATPIIAVTGTNGKSTTTTLIGEILAANGIVAAVGGNLGTPMLAQLTEAAAARYWVVEVSSYQLESTPSLHPRIAVLLNITPDHLDRYASMNDYVAAKARIVRNLTPADTLIFNADDPQVTEIAATSAAIRVPFRAPPVASRQSPANAVTGDQRPATSDAVGVAWADGPIRACVPGRMAQTWDLQDARLIGAHNHENMLAAGLACACAGADAATIERVLREFPGLPHRCRCVGERRGVRFFDDSKATNVGAVVKSLASFSTPIVLIAGGLDKGTGYAALQPIAREKVKCAILIGQARARLRDALHDCTVVAEVADMRHAVQMAAERAAPGDVVLLAPACASFDMYKDYAERGDDFARCVRELTLSTEH